MRLRSIRPRRSRHPRGRRAVLALGVFAAITALPAMAAAPAGSAQAALSLYATIAMPQMSGTWDHLTSDPTTGRLFLSAQDEHTVDVVDLHHLRPLRRIQHVFNRPQGEIYLTGLGRLVVTNGRDGTARIIDGRSYQLLKTVQLSMGADMMAFDPRTDRLYAESGGTDSKRGPGKLSVIDPVAGTIVAEIETGFRPAALAMETARPRLYVAIPAADEVAVVDTATGAIVSRLPTPGRPASITLDERTHRLFVTTRTFPGDARPPTFNVINTETGVIMGSAGSQDGVESMFFDAARDRVYATGLEGVVQAWERAPSGGYRLVASIPTAPHAGTSEFIPELGLLCVAVPPHDGRPAEVLVFRPASAEPSRDRAS